MPIRGGISPQKPPRPQEPRRCQRSERPLTLAGGSTSRAPRDAYRR